MTRFQYRFVISLLVILLIAAVGYIAYPFIGNRLVTVDGEEPIVDEATSVVEAVGKLMFLPEGEEPTVATVTNLAELAGQPFFAHARIGHKVLIYTKAQKAILFDPVAGKIVEVAPLSIEVPQPAGTTTESI